MSEEDLIEVLRQFDEKRVEELPEKTRNIFYAIMKIVDERDRLNNIINYIWQVFENGGFEDGCDCIKIYDYLKELKEK